MIPHRRLSVLIAVVSGMTLLLFARLVQLQVVEYDRHSHRAESIRLTRTLVPGRRATVVDRYGATLARDEPVWELHINYWLFSEPANMLERIRYRGGVPDFTPLQTERLVGHLEELARIKADHSRSRPRRFRMTWEARQHPLVQMELIATLGQLERIIRVPAGTMYAQMKRVVDEVNRTLQDPELRESERYQRIVRLGGSSAFWEDEARLERRERRRHPDQYVNQPPRFQDNPLVLAVDVPREAVETVTELDRIFTGISGVSRARRVYPEGATACHVLGYLREVERVAETEELTESRYFRDLMRTAERDVGMRFIRSHFQTTEEFQRAFRRQVFRSPVGVTGLERYYQDRLCGRFGASVMERDVHRRTQRFLDEVEPSPGEDMQLTLDIEAQAVAQRELRRIFDRIGSPGAAVAIDVQTGEILVMASYPDFDLNRMMGRSEDDREWMNRMFTYGKEHGSPFFNRAVHATVAPGSVFKIVVGAAGASCGLLHGPDYTGTCACTGTWQGREQLGIRRGFTCHGGIGCGTLTLAHALERSCNIYFHDLGHKMGYDQLRAWAQRFGLGEQTGVDFAEFNPWRTGRDGTRVNWELPAKATSKADAALVSIGQGRLLATPLQVTRMMAAVATGGWLPTPHLVRGGDADEPPQLIEGIDPGVWAVIHEGLERVVTGSHGTARRVTELRRLRVAGKTGTAQTSRKRDGRELNFAWFAGYAPVETPRIAVAVYVEDTWLSGGQAAAPIVADIVDALADSPDYAAAFGREPRDATDE